MYDSHDWAPSSVACVPVLIGVIYRYFASIETQSGCYDFVRIE